jgi:Protein kinase domain
VLEILGEPLATGSVIAGAYRLEHVVGEGGMGVVWAAREIATGRAVALKFLREGREVDVRNQQRVLREARAAMAISHPNIAKVEAVLETDAGVPFLVMELLEGESLRALLRRRGVLSPVECARVLLPVVDAVLAAHASHIVHRDLKPENVFIANGQRVRVLDFGIAKQLSKTGEAEVASLTSIGAVIGTPIYMAPEQVFGDEDVDGAADVWSLGIMLYECLAAKRPTDGDGFGPIIKRITTETLEPLEQARPGLPRRITSLVGRMLTRRRSERPPLAEVRTVLASILDAGEGAVPSERAPDLPPELAPAFVGTTTGGMASRRALSDPSPARKRHPAFLPLAAVAVLGALGGTFYVARVGRAHSAPPAAAPPWVDATKLAREANAASAHRDGATCLKRLDEYDAAITAESGGRSTNPSSGLATSRATCLMLTGRCSEGKALYAEWFKPYAAEAGIAGMLEGSVQGTVRSYCEGDDLPLPDQLVRSDWRLQGIIPGAGAPTAAACRGWADDQRRLIPQVSGNPLLLGVSPTEITLAKCLERVPR